MFCSFQCARPLLLLLNFFLSISFWCYRECNCFLNFVFGLFIINVEQYNYFCIWTLHLVWDLTKLAYSSRFFVFWDYVGFSVFRIMLFANTVLVLSNLNAFSFFSCLNALVSEISNMILKRSGENRHSLSGNIHSLTTDIIYGFSQMPIINVRMSPLSLVCIGRSVGYYQMLFLYLLKCGFCSLFYQYSMLSYCQIQTNLAYIG